MGGGRMVRWREGRSAEVICVVCTVPIRRRIGNWDTTSPVGVACTQQEEKKLERPILILRLRVDVVNVNWWEPKNWKIGNEITQNWEIKLNFKNYPWQMRKYQYSFLYPKQKRSCFLLVRKFVCLERAYKNSTCLMNRQIDSLGETQQKQFFALFWNETWFFGSFNLFIFLYLILNLEFLLHFHFKTFL